MAVGLFARIWMLGAHSLLLDEASVSIGARDILRNHTPMWDAISNAPFVWMVAQLIGLSHLANPFFVRLPSALFGTASIILVYWLARRLVSNTAAIASAILFAVHPFAVAFNRVLFADSFQLFFILAGCLAFEYYNRKDQPPKREGLLVVLIFLVWSAAFVMKYNAVVPGALWLAAGVVTGRYRVGRAVISFLAMAFGAFITLLPWPYDAPIWLFAFLGKGGSYSIVNATHFFWGKLHLILFGITEIVLLAGIAALFDPIPSRKATLQTTLFVIFYLITISILGRTFERYLLVLVPFVAMLLSALVIAAFQTNLAKPFQIAVRTIALIVTGIFVYGMSNAYAHYFSYLSNDVDREALANEAICIEQNGTQRGFWLIPEPIGGYYLGMSQCYSREVRPCLDGNLGEQNYFEWESMPYCEHKEGIGIFAIRDLARRWGVWNILTSPRRFADSARIIRSQIAALPLPTAIDYLTSDFVRSGDLLVMQSGMTDVQEEPILEDISHESGPPYLKYLPLDRFRVLKVFRPAGISSTDDTTITRVEAGAWLLEKK